MVLINGEKSFKSDMEKIKKNSIEILNLLKKRINVYYICQLEYGGERLKTLVKSYKKIKKKEHKKENQKITI